MAHIISLRDGRPEGTDTWRLPACAERESGCVTTCGQLLTWGRGSDGRLGHGRPYVDVDAPRLVSASAAAAASSSPSPPSPPSIKRSLRSAASLASVSLAFFSLFRFLLAFTDAAEASLSPRDDDELSEPSSED